MAELFEPTVINGMTLANRFVRSATWEGLATREGYATEGLTKLLTDLARGKVGLIITSHAYVTPRGSGSARPIRHLYRWSCAFTQGDG